jgi:hypothetical protein
MQVLVALARANGAVITRDQLIDWCWDGRIVSENAINRVISRLRQVAAEFAIGAFQLETITKVGYRLIILSPPAKSESDQACCPPPVDTDQVAGAANALRSRRSVLGGLSVVTLFTAVTGASRLSLPPADHSSRTATELYRKGVEARAQGVLNMVGQAEAYFAQAVEADPHYGPAWAALALTRAGQLSWEHGSEQGMMAARARFAAERALRIDPALVEAQRAWPSFPACLAAG